MIGPICLLASCWLVIQADHSIMDIINTDYVEKLLAERKLNESRDLKVQWDTYNLVHPNEENVISEDDIPDINGNSIAPQGRIPKSNLPDFSAVLSELGRGDKLLKAEPTSLLVTKKEYLRKDWCRTEPILQKIREEGCTPKNIVNRFCYGQCNSFFIPKNLTPRRGKKKKNIDKNEESLSFRSCGFCKPKRTVWVQVTLNCSGSNQPLRRRKVQKIKQCQCMAESFH